MTNSEKKQRYMNVFLNNEDGQFILEDLVGRFHDREIFDRDSARQTDVNIGKRQVIRYILGQLSQIVQPQGEENE